MKYDKYVILDVAQVSTRVTGNITWTKFKGHQAQYIALTKEAIAKKGLLNDLTALSKIILIGHGAAGSDLIKTQDGVKKSGEDKNAISCSEIAEFLKKNLCEINIKPRPVGLNEREIAKRRLTIQLCVCYAAEDKKLEDGWIESYSMMYSLFLALRVEQLHELINIVGYASEVIVKPGPTWMGGVNKLDLKGFYPTGGKTGFGRLFSSDKKVRTLNKFIINSESYGERQSFSVQLTKNMNYEYYYDYMYKYDTKWKDFKLEILEQLRLELDNPELNDRVSAKAKREMQRIKELFPAEFDFNTARDVLPVDNALFSNVLKAINENIKKNQSWTPKP